MATASSKPAQNDDGWEDVVTEGQIVFDTIGDTFTGVFVGWSETDNNIAQAHFKNAEGEFFTNCGWSLKQQLKTVRKGSEVKITYISDQDTGQASPMRVFRVQHRQAR
jgi:hypothetical protein